MRLAYRQTCWAFSFLFIKYFHLFLIMFLPSPTPHKIFSTSLPTQLFVFLSLFLSLCLLKKGERNLIKKTAGIANNFLARGGNPCPFQPLSAGTPFGLCWAGLVPATTVTVWCDVQLSCCIWRHCFIRVIYHLWFLQSFHILLHVHPWSSRGRVWWKHHI